MLKELIVKPSPCSGERKPKKGSKSDKNGKRVEAEKSLKQLQLKEEEKPKKTKKEWPKTIILFTPPPDTKTDLHHSPSLL
nr:hypothetical protein [Tanacetum cinerariifolium]